MSNTVTWTQDITFPDESVIPVTFTATFSMGGIGAYEFWGAKGTHNELELDEINFEAKGLTLKDVELINEMIENFELDDRAWEELGKQPDDSGPDPDDFPQAEE